MKKIAFILFLIASMASCKKESGDCYKCIPLPIQPYSGDTIICEGHVKFDRAASNILADDNAQQINCKKMQ